MLSGLAADGDEATRTRFASAGGSATRLVRRGVDHGDLWSFPAALDPRSRPVPPSRSRRRFAEARPIARPGLLAERLADWRNELHASARAHGRLLESRSLSPLRSGRQTAFELCASDAALSDPERDLARATFRERGGGPAAAELWAKLTRLSTHPEDASLRIRLGFGREGVDDSRDDPASRRRVARLAKHLFPWRALLDRRALASIAACSGTILEPSLDIVYWNRPNGGALFHHDAFADTGDAQRGVLFCQLLGSTAWLALSIADLARRLEELAGLLDEGQAPWLDEDPSLSEALASLRSLRGDRLALIRELGVPGTGRLAPLVNRGPEVTGLLADLGHALILHPGDALLLPNHGRLATCMHSVFCASEGPNLALSTALFET